MRKITRVHLEKFLSRHASQEHALDIGASGSSYQRFFPNRVSIDIDPWMTMIVSALKNRCFWKSVISGGITAIADLSLLFMFREILHLSYWLSINAAFAAAILINFSLQKFWTFSSRDWDGAHRQFMKFFLVALGNMALNSFLMFLLSVVLGLWYLGAQILTMGMLAVVNFALYRRFVFN